MEILDSMEMLWRQLDMSPEFLGGRFWLVMCKLAAISLGWNLSRETEGGGGHVQRRGGPRSEPWALRSQEVKEKRRNQPRGLLPGVTADLGKSTMMG